MLISSDLYSVGDSLFSCPPSITPFHGDLSFSYFIFPCRIFILFSFEAALPLFIIFCFLQFFSSSFFSVPSPCFLALHRSPHHQGFTFISLLIVCLALSRMSAAQGHRALVCPVPQPKTKPSALLCACGSPSRGPPACPSTVHVPPLLSLSLSCLPPRPLPPHSTGPVGPTHGSGYFFHSSLAGSVWYTVFCFPSELGLLGLLCTTLAHSICSSHEPDST